MSNRKPTLVFVGQSISDRKLIKTTKYKAFLTPEENKELLAEVPMEIGDDCTVEIFVSIEIKKYDTKNTGV